MDTNTVQVVTEFGNKLDSYIAVLASKAGVVAEHFYPVLVRQQVIEGWSSVALLLVSLIGCILAFTVVFKSIPKNDPDDITPKQVVSSITGGVVGVILFLITLFETGELSTDISKINNPEFHAIKSLIQMVK